SSASSTASVPGPAAPEPEPAASTAATSSARSRAAARTSRVSVLRTTPTRTTAPTTIATPTTATAATVVRSRTDPGTTRRRSAAIGHEPVAASAARLGGGPAEGPVELVAEVADVDLDDVGGTLEL